MRGEIEADYWSVASFDNPNCLLVIIVVLPDLSIVVLYILLKVHQHPTLCGSYKVP